MNTKRITVPITQVRYGRQRITPGSYSEVVERVRKMLIRSDDTSNDPRRFYEELSMKIYVRKGFFEVNGKNVEVYRKVRIK